MATIQQAEARVEGDEGWQWESSFRCACGAWCEEWHDHDRHYWRVRHGAGEAVFTIAFDQVIADLAEPVSTYSRWVERVHEYEQRRAVQGALALGTGRVR